jgi:CRISPR system Cascade subunit CasD
MTSFLLFTLYAPLASWGEIAVGEARGSWDRPSRSAVLGLLAAALGITREDQDGHDALDAGYGFAVRLDAGGASLMDYHTAQTAAETEIKKAFGKERPQTRRALLSVAERQTILSRRELREDALATACLWERQGARWPLEALRQALQRPVFTLYAGRKANAFGLPVGPAIMDADSLAGAFTQRPPRRAEDAFKILDRLKSRNAWGREVAHDPLPQGIANGLTAVRSETRRDGSPQRERWQFAERTVTIGLLPEETGP